MSNSKSPIRSWRFIAVASVLLWVIICLPVSTLLSWLLDTNTSKWILASVATAPFVTLWMWLSVQSANLALKWPAMQLLGWTTVLLSVVVFASPLLLFLSAPTTGLIALIAWITLLYYGVYAANKIHNKTITIKSEKLVKSYRFVQLSDVHAGSRSRKFIQKITIQANQHKPDAVFITGDLIDSSSVDASFIEPLGGLTSPTWMCIGNHERYVNLQNAIDAITQHRIKILRNEATVVNDICLIGIDDADNPQQVVEQLPLIERDSSKFQILLYHKPDGWQSACQHNIDLTLAGHTHGGQVWPFGILVKRQFPELQGYFNRGLSHLYVSPGTGTWGPVLRLGTRCEMTIIELVPTSSAA